MRKELREKAIKLRVEKEMSYGAIRDKLGVPKSTLSYWLREHPLSEERILKLRRKGWEKGEASRERYRNTMRQKREDLQKKVYEGELCKLRNLHVNSIYIAGLMLYLGEGSKKDRYTISVSNTDPSIIKFFMKWMIKFLNVPEEEIKIQLHLYENMNIAKEINFWKNTLCIKNDQLYKTQIRKLKKGSFSYNESFRHGTCQISYNNGKKKMKLMMGIKAFVDLYLK